MSPSNPKKSGSESTNVTTVIASDATRRTPTDRRGTNRRASPAAPGRNVTTDTSGIIYGVLEARRAPRVARERCAPASFIGCGKHGELRGWPEKDAHRHRTCETGAGGWFHHRLSRKARIATAPASIVSA